MVLIKGNKRTFRRPLEKVSITTYYISSNNVGRETDTITYINKQKHIQEKIPLNII
jgi:hypothetical protein